MERDGLQLEQQPRPARPEDVDELLEGGDPLPGEPLGVPAAGVQPADLVSGEVADEPGCAAWEHSPVVRGAHQRGVVQEDQGTVLGALDVDLDVIRVARDRPSHGGERVLRCF